MICRCGWFIHPATAISTNRNGSRTLGIVKSLSRDLRTAVLFQADPVSGPYGVREATSALFIRVIMSFYHTVQQNRKCSNCPRTCSRNWRVDEVPEMLEAFEDNFSSRADGTTARLMLDPVGANCQAG